MDGAQCGSRACADGRQLCDDFFVLDRLRRLLYAILGCSNDLAVLTAFWPYCSWPNIAYCTQP